MPAFPDTSPVLRLLDVRASREDLEAAFGVALSRYEPYRKGPGTYAQVNFPDGADWDGVVAEMRRLGPALRLAVEQGKIVGLRLDVGIYLPRDCFHRGLIFPSALCEALGQWGVELELSVYPVWEAEPEDASDSASDPPAD